MKTKIIIFVIIFVFLGSSFLIQNSFAQWEPDVRLTNAAGISNTSNNNARCIEANGNVVHAVWYDNRDGNNEIYYKRSTSGGVTWDADTRLTNNVAFSEYPSIAVSGSIVHLVWIDYRDGNNELYYKRSTNGGVNWGMDTNLTNNPFLSWYPSIAVTGSNVHIVWYDGRDGNYEVYYKRSTDGGTTWGEDIRQTYNNSPSRNPSIAVFGSNVHLVWFEPRTGNNEIFYNRSTDGGINWESDTLLTNNSAESWYPSIAVSGSNVHVVWYDERDGNREIYYKLSTDAGVSWGADTRLTNNTAFSMYPSITVSGSLAHVVWVDTRNFNEEIYYKLSTNNGINWIEDTRLTNNTSASQYPSVAVSGSVVHVVWIDLRDGNNEIYYKRNPTGNLTGIQNISTEIPSAFSLEQNYPNPFNPSTNFEFRIAEFGFVNLTIYDVMGREVTTLVNENLKPGTYKADWDAAKYPSGVYFYKVIAGNYTDTKRMVLVK